MGISVDAGPCCLSGHLQSPLCSECEVETDSPGAWYGLHAKMSPVLLCSCVSCPGLLGFALSSFSHFLLPFFLKTSFNFVCMSVCLKVCKCSMCVPSACRGQMRASDL